VRTGIGTANNKENVRFGTSAERDGSAKR